MAAILYRNYLELFFITKNGKRIFTSLRVKVSPNTTKKLCNQFPLFVTEVREILKNGVNIIRIILYEKYSSFLVEYFSDTWKHSHDILNLMEFPVFALWFYSVNIRIMQKDHCFDKIKKHSKLLYSPFRT